MVFVCFYRQDAAKRQTAGIKFTHKTKISIFAPKGQLVAPIHVKFVETKGHVGPLGHTKFHANRFAGVGTRPQNIKNFHFLVKSLLSGANPLIDF